MLNWCELRILTVWVAASSEGKLDKYERLTCSLPKGIDLSVRGVSEHPFDHVRDLVSAYRSHISRRAKADQLEMLPLTK